MTSVGYGDLGPKNVVERTVCTMMILTAGLCWAYVLGEVCGIVTEMTFDSQRFRKRGLAASELLGAVGGRAVGEIGMDQQPVAVPTVMTREF